MGAFSIAFDTVIVGALSLAWVLLVVHLFFSDKESILKNFAEKDKQKQPALARILWNQPALAGILLFTLAYPLGSVVSRIAQDFFDDDDLHFRVQNRLFRVGVTESSIRANAFCTIFKRGKVSAKPDDPTVEKHGTFTADDPTTYKRAILTTSDPDCKRTGRWIVRQGCYESPNGSKQTWTSSSQIDCKNGPYEWIDRQQIDIQQDLAEEIFSFQEAAVLSQGTDPNERLRQFHDQIIVLRGAAFSGMLAFSLCLFWWCAKFHSPLRWTVLLIFLFPSGIAIANHIQDHLNEPPFMEFSLLALAVAGAYLLRNGAQQVDAQNGWGTIQFTHLLLALFLTVAAFLGWWATQVLYNQQVIYSYEAMRDIPHDPAKSAYK
ncbi:MAG: hypothetical protein ABSC33_05070 [Candidatus Sulfotelmatobacter sp.]|jgi:hypothetical protein